MNRGAHLLATGSAGVEGRFVREIMLSLYGISVGEKVQEREGSPLFICDGSGQVQEEGRHPLPF